MNTKWKGNAGILGVFSIIAVIFIPVGLKNNQKRTINDINRIHAEETFNQEKRNISCIFGRKLVFLVKK
ncbi:hypothetical protein [Niallia taxi]|uniref:hypothetical protein n=1 Tax=Niallia taxi TaxID=2499688 RepID=UPI002E219FCE|nr:hypothetical protein [Niallia taxi]